MKTSKTQKSAAVRSQNGPKQSAKQVKNSRAYLWLGMAFIGVLGFVIYSNSFGCSFQIDDAPHIVNNMAIRSLSNLGKLWQHDPSLPGLSFMPYRPLPMTTFALNYHFSELDVWPYHLVNVSIHIINALLTGWLTLLIFSTPVLEGGPVGRHKKVLALLTSLLFVSHPLATQSVTYIVQRMNLMATLFYLLSLSLYMVGRLRDKGSREKYILFGAAFLCTVLAILSKENSVTIPFAIVLIEICFFRTKAVSINFKDYRVIVSIIALLVGTIIFLKFSQNIFKPLPPSEYNDFTTITPINYLLTQFTVIVKYIQLLILPVNQNLDHYVPVSTGFFGIWTMLCFLLLVSLFALALFLFNKHRIVSFGILWFFLTLSVESGIIPIDDVIFEHRTYLPSFGFFMIVVYCVYVLCWTNYKYAGLGILALIIGANSILTYERNKVWENGLTLWTDAVSKSPHKARAIYTLGTAYLGLGKNEEAVKECSLAIELKPNYSKAYLNRGNASIGLGKYVDALRDFDTVIKQKPDFADGYYNRGYVYRALGKNEEAIKDFSKAIMLNPDLAETYNNRGGAYLAVKQYDSAIMDFGEAVRRNPNMAVAYSNRGNAYAALGKNDEAIKDYNAAIMVDPNYADTYINRGNWHYTRTEYDEAIKDYTKAINLNAGYAQAYNNRGHAYLAEQKNQRALDDLKKASQLGFAVDPAVISNLESKILNGAM